MKTKKLTLLGKADSIITMILDNLESNDYYPTIEIINNKNLEVLHPFSNPKFDISISNKIDEIEKCFLAVGNSSSKKELFNLFGINIEKYVSIINKLSFLSSTTEIGTGVLINSLVSVAAQSSIGNFVTINRNCSVGHHTKIGDFVTINPGVNVAGFCEVGEGTTLGMGTNVLDKVKIGKNVVIGAGSVVTKNIPDNVIAYGVPCKIIKEL